MTPQTAPSRNPLLLVLPVGLVALIAGGIWYFSHQPKPGVLQLSGRLEGYETDLGAKVPGRINLIKVREGDPVKSGQILVQMDDAEVKAQLAGARAQVSAAQERARQARLQIDVLDSQLRQAKLTIQQAQGDSQGRVFQSEATLAQAEAQLAQAQAQLVQAEADAQLAQLNKTRYQSLVERGAINQQQYDQAATAVQTTQATVQARQAAVAAARKQVNASQGSLTQSKTSLLNPAIRSAELEVIRNQRIQAQSQLEGALANERSALATQTQIAAQMAYLTVRSPIDGVVTTRSVEPGAVVSQGKTLLTVLNQKTVYLRGYVPEGRIGEVRVGQAAQVFLDSAPDKPLAAHVLTIDPQASFTPENIYFRDERVKQVFGVKIGLDQPGGYAKPGMPADAEIGVKP